MNFKDDVLKTLDIHLSSLQLEQFHQYFEFLVKYNQSVNLTSITDQEEVYYKHFFDSLSLTKCVDLSQVITLCDMGAGAGFPSIPVKIAFPHLQITIVDSLNKRILFLNELLQRLGLDCVRTVHDRIENFGKKNVNQFDLVTARALGPLPLILEMGLPITRIDGHFIAFKATSYQKELETAHSALNNLAGSIENVTTLELPKDYGFRALIRVKKNRHVSGYPRTYALMLKKPL